ncbi:hypothetical protein D5F01_LYC02290 [Larimichthys crocea]|uniref:Peptidase A2 domain-containing protein n=1 Tax=Larimichthys crocea TaxID=215358 RepID=A0A6G0J8T2_LARCR|nr:hypothetical protein D5F01_LYC02290 [Larimichthys crocea]
MVESHHRLPQSVCRPHHCFLLAISGHPVGLSASVYNTEPRPRVQPGLKIPFSNPPEVQCYVVEHIVKNDDSAIHSTQRLRAFSGRLPRPQNESDYEIWRSGIELLLQDPAVSDLQRSPRLPKGLVRSCCTANIKIAGEEFDCLLDTGSQVTKIPVLFSNQHFADQPVKSLCDLLQVEGATGQAVPYLGYVEMVVTFPSEFLGVNFDVSTLALVVPDVAAHQSPVLIGMNTLEPLYNQHTGSEYANFQPTAHSYKAVLKLLQICH